MNNMNTLFPAEDQPSAYALAELGFTNPFGSERIDLEKKSKKGKKSKMTEEPEAEPGTVVPEGK